jgi:hypothetical protein
MGSGVPALNDLRNFVKDRAKLREWGMKESMHPSFYKLNGSQSGTLTYKTGPDMDKSKKEAWQCGEPG